MEPVSNEKRDQEVVSGSKEVRFSTVSDEKRAIRRDNLTTSEKVKRFLWLCLSREDPIRKSKKDEYDRLAQKRASRVIVRADDPNLKDIHVLLVRQLGHVGYRGGYAVEGRFDPQWPKMCDVYACDNDGNVGEKAVAYAAELSDAAFAALNPLWAAKGIVAIPTAKEAVKRAITSPVPHAPSPALSGGGDLDVVDVDAITPASNVRGNGGMPRGRSTR